MRDRQKSAQQSTAPKSNAPSHLLASRPFAPQPKPEAIGQSPSSAGSESRLLEFAILNPEPGLQEMRIGQGEIAQLED